MASLISGCAHCCGSKDNSAAKDVNHAAVTPPSSSSSAPQPGNSSSISSSTSASASVTTKTATGVGSPSSASAKVELFDGQSLKGWKLTDFAGAGEVKVQPGFKGDQPAIVLEQGIMTGITWTNPLPRMSYEISLEAMRVSGSDFFCGLTFPVGEKHLSLIVGGWGGSVVGISSVDGEDAAHNETTKYMNFDAGKWYRIKLRVEPEKVQAWINDEQMVNLVTTERVLTIRLEVEASTPLGVATWNTSGALRHLKWTALK